MLFESALPSTCCAAHGRVHWTGSSPLVLTIDVAILRTDLLEAPSIQVPHHVGYGVTFRLISSIELLSQVAQAAQSVDIPHLACEG